MHCKYAKSLIWPHKQMIYAQPGMRSGEWDYKVLLDFEIQTYHQDLDDCEQKK